MEKKIIFIAIVAFVLGIGAYLLFAPRAVVQTEKKDSVSQDTTATTTASSTEPIVKKASVYSAVVSDTKGVVISVDGSVVGAVGNEKIGVSGASFVSVHKIEKTGDQFFVVVHHSDNSADFGIVSGKNISYNPLTKNSGIKNVGSGIVFSSQKKYAAFQYVRDGGECKKDLMLGVVNLESGKISYPDVRRSYEVGTGKWQIEMGGFRFDGDTKLQFVDMPRACDGIGNYDAQKYYSWNIETGELGTLSF